MGLPFSWQLSTKCHRLQERTQHKFSSQQQRALLVLLSKLQVKPSIVTDTALVIVSWVIPSLVIMTASRHGLVASFRLTLQPGLLAEEEQNKAKHHCLPCILRDSSSNVPVCCKLATGLLAYPHTPCAGCWEEGRRVPSPLLHRYPCSCSCSLSSCILGSHLLQLCASGMASSVIQPQRKFEIRGL